MEKHKYKVGQVVGFAANSQIRAAGGNYTVTARLPADGRGPQYRIKSKQEPHERLVAEADLSAV